MGFDFFVNLGKGIGEALIPIKNLNPNSIIQAVKNPIVYKKLVLDQKQAILVYLDDTGDIKIIGGIEYANVVFNPEIGKGWVISKKSTRKMEGKRAYLVSPKIPFTLDMNEDDAQKQYSIPGKIRQMLGLPQNWIQLQCDMLAMMAMSKWNAGFDESKGSVMVALFGAAVGLAIGVVMTFVLIVVLGAIT